MLPAEMKKIRVVRRLSSSGPKRWGPCKHSAKQKAFGTVLAWAVYFLLRRPKAPMSSGGLLGAFERRGEGGGGWGYI